MIPEVISYLSEAKEKPSIDVRTIRLLIGCIAIGLAVLVQMVSPNHLTSISASYFSGDWPRNFFVGCLFVIAGFLISYNGELRIEQLLSKIAAIAAIGVAVFPCNCVVEAESHGVTTLQCLGEKAERYKEVSRCLIGFQEISGAHGGSAFVMFGVLAIFCLIFYSRAKKKDDERRTAARRRMVIYEATLILIIASTISLLYDNFSGGKLREVWSTFVFWAEFAGLVSFGISWLAASHVLPGFAHEQIERYRPFSRVNPPEPRAQASN